MHTVVVVITDDGSFENELAPFDQDLEVEVVSTEGDEIEYSNPDTMWDFYVVGGRWEGQLIRKADGTPVDVAEVHELDTEFGIMNMDTMSYVPEVLYEGFWYTEEDDCRTILYGLRNMPNKHVAIIDYHI